MRVFLIRLKNPTSDTREAPVSNLAEECRELKMRNTVLTEKCRALEALLLDLNDELKEERYRHDRLQDFEVAESQQLAEAREALRQIRALAKSYFGEEG